MKRSTVVSLTLAGILVVGIGIALIVIGATRAAERAAATATPVVSSSTEATSEEKMPAATIDGAAGPGVYVDYSEEALAAAEGTRILFFHAPWCPQCRALEADIQAVGVPQGMTILKVDYDSNQQLRQEYGVTLQTTLVAVDENGEKVSLFVAYDDPTLDAGIAGLGL
ncbi:hypothetical protein GCM10009808_22790 [Microbacterium sediminicola]|uniref:Thioredoxin domain-containing protein n=1 Tax=Microbacterium sediminicola TaxID=415210 RepID=A0ABN2IGH4_9MICO